MINQGTNYSFFNFKTFLGVLRIKYFYQPKKHKNSPRTAFAPTYINDLYRIYTFD